MIRAPAIRLAPTLAAPSITETAITFAPIPKTPDDPAQLIATRTACHGKSARFIDPVLMQKFL